MGINFKQIFDQSGKTIPGQRGLGNNDDEELYHIL